MQIDENEASYAEACALLVKHETAEAIRVLELGLSRDEDDARLWSLLGVAQWSVGAVEDSIRSLETALTLAPLGAEGRLSLALGYEVIQKHSLAKDLFVALAEERELPSRVLEPLARALGRAERPALALKVCKQAAARRPESTGPLRGMAYYLNQLGAEPEETLPPLFKAFHLEPNNFDIRLLLAGRLCECGRAQDGAYLLSVLEIENACCPRCLNAMHQVFIEAGDDENAARCVASLVRIAERGDESAD